MLSTEQTKLVSSPCGMLFHQRGFTFSLAPEEETLRTGRGEAAWRGHSWGCARLRVASFGVAAPMLAVEPLIGLPSLGFRVNAGSRGRAPFLLRLLFHMFSVVEVNCVSGARGRAKPGLRAIPQGGLTPQGSLGDSCPPLLQPASSPRGCQLRSHPGGPGCWAASPPISALDYLRQISSLDF